MMPARCKYSRSRLKQIVNERGIMSAVDEIDSSAVEDADLKAIWLSIERCYQKLEDLLTEDRT